MVGRSWKPSSGQSVCTDTQLVLETICFLFEQSKLTYTQCFSFSALGGLGSVLPKSHCAVAAGYGSTKAGRAHREIYLEGNWGSNRQQNEVATSSGGQIVLPLPSFRAARLNPVSVNHAKCCVFTQGCEGSCAISSAHRFPWVSRAPPDKM